MFLSGCYSDPTDSVSQSTDISSVKKE